MINNQRLFEKYKEGNHWENHPVSYAKKFSNFLKSKKFRGLLVDIGCGNDRDIKEFTDNVIDCVGIDNDKKIIETANKKFPNCNFKVQNAEDLKFDNCSVSAIFIINVIHYLNNKKAIKEVYRILKPRGYLFIHFNLLIVDNKGKIDYEHRKEDILKLISKFKIIDDYIFERVDNYPTKHKHKILELVLQK